MYKYFSKSGNFGTFVGGGGGRGGPLHPEVIKLVPRGELQGDQGDAGGGCHCGHESVLVNCER